MPQNTRPRPAFPCQVALFRFHSQRFRRCAISQFYELCVPNGTCHCTLGTPILHTLLIIKVLPKHMVPNRTIYRMLGTFRFY